MQKIKSTLLATIAMVAIFAHSVAAVSFLKLSPQLQNDYTSWHQTSGVTVFPYIEYKYGNATYKSTFFSDEYLFDTMVQIPSNILELDIYLPTAMFGNVIKFQISAERNLLYFNISDIEDGIFYINPGPLIYDETLYYITMEYVTDSEQQIYRRCLLIPEAQP
ncbi:MAG: hypothetical protein WCS92_04105 [Candidatus Babeliales bacterium]|jgi:hypothetical protein